MRNLILSAAVVFSTLTFAQQFGIKGGMNLSSVTNTKNALGVSTDPDIDSKSKVGFYGGLFVNAPLAANFSIQPEVLYNNVGTKLTGRDNMGNDGSLMLNLDYISVPVMFQYNATPAFYLEAGPQFGYMVDSSLKSKYNGQTTSVALDDDDFNRFDIGVGLGAGYYITPQFGITARYVAGFTDIVKDNTTNDKLKNNNFQLGLAFKFGK